MTRDTAPLGRANDARNARDRESIERLEGQQKARTLTAIGGVAPLYLDDGRAIVGNVPGYPPSFAPDTDQISRAE